MGLSRSSFPTGQSCSSDTNFDKVQGHLNSVTRGIEIINEPTWRKLREYIAFAEVTPEQCFFTNALMGLQPQVARGQLRTSKVFRQECQAFLNEQIAIVEPRALVPLGPVASEDVLQIGTLVPSLPLLHPYATIRHADLAPSEGRRLRQFLRNLSGVGA